jgi:hypothetical protein
LPGLAGFCERAQQFGLVWYATVSSALLQRLDYNNEACAQIAQQYKDSPLNAILDLLPQQSKWQRALDALTQLKDAPTKVKENQAARMIWLVSLQDNQVVMEAQEQKTR